MKNQEKMETDNFFSASFCDRCKGPLIKRTTSWFTEETLCMECHKKELEVRRCLPHGGRYFEGCGFIPETVGDVYPDMKKPWIRRLFNSNEFPNGRTSE